MTAKSTARAQRKKNLWMFAGRLVMTGVALWGLEDGIVSGRFSIGRGRSVHLGDSPLTYYFIGMSIVVVIGLLIYGAGRSLNNLRRIARGETDFLL